MLTKSEKIKQSLQETKYKRSLQRCRVVQTKVSEKSLNKKSLESLFMFFVEAKWLYNHILNISKEESLFKIDYSKHKNVFVKNKYGDFIEKELVHLPACARQYLIKEMCQSIKKLSSLKKNGHKVGRLKFKKEYNTINIISSRDRKLKGNRLKITGIKQHLKLNGLHQINTEWEISNIKLIKKPSGYYVNFICWEFIKPENIPTSKGESIGIDFGIKNHLTLSNGETFNCTIEESERLKNLQRKLSRQKKGSNNRYKTILQIRKEYEKMVNKKKYAANKIVHYICSNYDFVYFQDENLSGWQRSYFGKQIQHSYLGLVKAKLRKKENTIMLDRYFPSTKLCYNCGQFNEISLSQRIYICDCGLVEDRDIKAAKTLLHVGQLKNKFLPMYNRTMLVEKNACVDSSLKQEVLERE